MDFNCVMIGSENPRQRADYYTKLFDDNYFQLVSPMPM